MLLNRTKAIFKIICRIRFVQITLILPVAVFFGRVAWDELTLARILDEGAFDVMSYTIGVIPASIVLFYYVVNVYQRYGVAEWFDNRTKYVASIYRFILSIAVLIAFVYTVMCFLFAYFAVTDIDNWGDKRQIVNIDTAFPLVGIRMFILAALFLIVCMSVFYLYINLSGEVILAAILTICILLLDLGQNLYTGQQFISGCIRIWTGLEFTTFIVAVSRLVMYNVLIFCFNLIVINKRDFLDIGEHNRSK